MEKEKLICEYQTDLKKVMDRIEEAKMDRRECMPHRRAQTSCTSVWHAKQPLFCPEGIDEGMISILKRGGDVWQNV